MRRKIVCVLTICFILAGMSAGCAGPVYSASVAEATTTLSAQSTPDMSESASDTKDNSPTPVRGHLTTEPTNEPAEIRVTLTAVGDIIMHKAVTDGGRTNPGESPPEYDHSYAFQYVRSVFEDSDLAIGNFEGTLAGPPYTGWPSFSAPDDIADALYDAGLRVICTANNHSIDKGFDGLVRTSAVFREKGFTVIGTRPDEDTPIDAVVDISGIRIGLINYTFETIGTPSRKALNGIPLPEGSDPLINSFNPYRSDAFETDLEAIIDDVERLRREGAEFICLILHWGVEYTTRSAAWQQEMAERLCDAGVGLIIGHHPHVLQEIEVLTSEKNGNQMLVYYSMGNFLGNWAYVSLGTNGKAQDGMIARITLVKTEDGVRIEKGEYIPTFVVRIYEGAILKHYIVPVLPALDDPEHYLTTSDAMNASYDRTHKILGSCTGTKSIPISEASGSTDRERS
ncbi:MAG: CapA family protein [Clostridiales bacterium]|nr:CapA family protein [Clostridiales bacterium]